MLCQRYNHFKETAFTNNLISYSNNQLFDVAGRTESPYAEDTVFVVSPVVNKFQTGNLSFVLSADRLVQNVGSFQSISIDLGNGFQTVTLGQSFSASFSSGMNRATMRVQLNDGRILQYRFEIEVEPTPPTPEGGPDETYDRTDIGLAPPANVPRTITADRTWNGQAATAEVTIFYACADKKLRKPLLVLDGFNANADEDAVTATAFITLFNNYTNTPVSTPSNRRAITRELRLEGYDLIFVNWQSEDGRDDLRRYAFLLQTILSKVNIEKAANGSTEKNAIIGLSMGGVIAKYALRDLERSNPSAANGGHDVKQLFTYDSPMQGANIPLGIQHLVKDLGEDMLGGFFRRFSPELRGGLKRLKSTAAQQLLIYQAFDGNQLSPSGFTSFYNELNSWGQLEKCDYKTVSNGSLIGTANFPAGKKLYGGTTFLPPIVAVAAFLDIDVRALPNGSPNFESIYKRTLILKVGILPPIFPYISRKNILVGSNVRPLDGAPGGNTDLTNSLDRAIPLMRSGRYDDGNGEILNPTFIPTVSALDIRSPESNNPFFNVSDPQALISSQITGGKGIVGSRSSTQFDFAVFGPNSGRIPNQTHVGLSYRTTGFMLYDLITTNPLRTVPNGILNNRTYNFGTNPQNFPLIPPSPGNFQPKTVNNIIDYTLSVENTGQLWVNRGGRIGFTDNTSAANNGSNSNYTLIIRKGDGCTVATDGILNVKNNGIVRVGDPSVTNAAIVKIQAGGTLRIQNAGNLIVENNSRIEIESGGKLIIDAGANINLVGPESTIYIKSGGELVINGNMNFSGNGFFQFDAGHILTLGADLVLRGSGRTQRMIRLNTAAYLTTNTLTINGHSLTLSDGLIEYGTRCQINITNGINEMNTINNVTFNVSGGFFVTALNFVNVANVSIQDCTFNNAERGVSIDSDINLLNFVNIGSCDFNDNQIGLRIRTSEARNVPTRGIFIHDCRFDYLSSGPATACRFENLFNTGVIFARTQFTGITDGVQWEDLIGIDLRNTSITLNDAIITRFKTGIKSDNDAFSNVNLVRTELSSCETGASIIGDVVNWNRYGHFEMSCSRLTNNRTGVRGQNVAININQGLNVFQNSAIANSLLFDVCYSPTENLTGNSNFTNIQATNNFWVGGFNNMRFNLNVKTIPQGICGTGKRRLEQCAQWETEPTNCTTLLTCCNRPNVTSDGNNGIVTTFPIVCLMGANNTTPRIATINKSDKQAAINEEDAIKAENKKISIYPNPASETVQLEIEKGNYHLRVSNTIGQTIFAQNTEGVLSVNVATWTNGIYLFELTDKATNKQQRSKIVVQH